jgi:hypothetical protein
MLCTGLTQNVGSLCVLDDIFETGKLFLSEYIMDKVEANN